MRFTFVILLFCCLGADAQMIIKAHANYRPYAVAAQNLLLDDYPNAAAAYSLRKLDKDYTGSAIRVRRSNDNSEQDIGFVGNDLDTASLKTFVGANSGFVTTWYDQSGNARNATQTTAANQPRIVNAGTVDRRNGKLIVFFDGTNDNLTHAAITANYQREHYSVMTNRDSTSTGILYELTSNFNNTTGAYIIYDDLINSRRQQLFGSVQNAGSGNYQIKIIAKNTSLNYELRNHILDASTTTKDNQMRLFINNTEQTLSYQGNFFNDIYNILIPAQASYIGSRQGGSAAMRLDLSEFIIYNSIQPTNRTGISNNINSYWTIY